MDYSSEFILRAVRVAQDRADAGAQPGRPWGDRPIGERVTLIYKEMQRLHAQASLAPALGGTQSLWTRARNVWQDRPGADTR